MAIIKDMTISEKNDYIKTYLIIPCIVGIVAGLVSVYISGKLFGVI